VSALAFGGSLYVVAPGGRISRLALDTLAAQASTVDPAGPRSVAESGGKIFVADGQTLTTLNSKTLAPISSVALPGAVALAGGSGRPLVALQRHGGSGGQLCVVTRKSVSPCASLSFVPAGALVTRGGIVYVVDTAGGRVVPYRLGSGAPVAGTAIAVGPKPQGSPVEIRNKLYVAVDHGIVPIALGTGVVSKTIALERTPSALAIPQVGGRVFAPLFGSNKIAIVDVAKPTAAPVLQPAGKGPVAIVQTAGGLVVVDAGTGSVAKVDSATGALGTTVRVASLGSKQSAIQAGAPRITASGTVVTVKIPLIGGSLDPAELHVTGVGISGGKASVELWQGGIAARGGSRSDHGLSVGSKRGPGRLVVTVSARAGDFTKFAASLSDHGRSVVFTVTQAPPPVQTSTFTPTTSSPPPTTPTTSSPPPTTPTTTPTTPTTTPTTSSPPPTNTTTSTPPPTHTTTQTFTVG
jgi:cell division septation protein DedD